MTRCLAGAARTERKCAAAAALAVTLVIAVAAPAWGAGPDAAIFEGDPALTRVSTALLQVRRAVRLGVDVQALRRDFPLLRFRPGGVEVDVTLSALTPPVVTALRAAGLESIAAYPH
ncbi:MAG: hypothetical protein ACREQY_11445, partial [Candidatus Binatia bacterium]